MVTNLGVFDFGTADHRMRLVSVHPGVTVDEVVAATGFELADRRTTCRRPGCRPTTSCALIREVIDPARTRSRRGRSGRDRRCGRRSATCSASAYPIVQTGMGWVSDARLTAATANAGGLGILASATMTYEELARAIGEVQDAHGRAVRGQPARRRPGRRASAPIC